MLLARELFVDDERLWEHFVRRGVCACVQLCTLFEAHFSSLFATCGIVLCRRGDRGKMTPLRRTLVNAHLDDKMEASSHSKQPFDSALDVEAPPIKESFPNR